MGGILDTCCGTKPKGLKAATEEAQIFVAI